LTKDALYKNMVFTNKFDIVAILMIIIADRDGIVRVIYKLV
jgi:hypothetical protein